jgi:DNA-directed RNA polymerase subunit RPC12/RpoP
LRAFWEKEGMVDLYQCTRCERPFLATDDRLVAMRDGRCLDCAKADLLEQSGLPPDFLGRSFGLGP